MNTEITNGQLVKGVQATLGDADFSVSALPRFLKTVIEEEAWKRRILPHSPNQELVEFKSFKEFVTTPLLQGLGTTVEHLKNICADDIEAQTLIDAAVKEKPGNRKGTNRFTGRTVDNVHSSIRPSGNEQSRALRRLRTQRPDLHSKVLKGELSPHAAMIEAGFREKKIEIAVDPERAARIIKKYFNEDQIASLIDHLMR